MQIAAEGRSRFGRLVHIFFLILQVSSLVFHEGLGIFHDFAYDYSVRNIAELRFISDNWLEFFNEILTI